MPKGIRKIHFTFGKTGLTRWGGLSLFVQFCKYLGLRRFLQIYVRWPDYNHRAYHPADLFLAHIYSLVIGIGRIENSQSLIHNGLIPPLLGLPEFPHRDTLRTFLWRFDKFHLKSLQIAHNNLRKHLYHSLGLQYSATIDIDTTALMTYGHQEGVAVGYIPKRRHGKPSYAPIISSEGHTGLSLGAELRSGNVHATTGAWLFLESIIEKLPSTIATSRTRIRLDGAFYDKDIIRKLDEIRIPYVIVARMTAPLKRAMLSAKYHEYAEGWEAAEFAYSPFNWDHPHRFAAIRRLRKLEPEDIQLRFFTTGIYTYHRVLVTGNLGLTPESVYRFYCDRAFQELLLREFKNALNMVKIPTRNYWANYTYMETILWAYDLVLAFQFLCLPKEFQHWNMSTLRRELWWLPAECVKHGNSNILRLPAKYPRQHLFFQIQRATCKVKSLF